MPLKGKAKTDYMREYMRRKRAGEGQARRTAKKTAATRRKIK